MRALAWSLPVLAWFVVVGFLANDIATQRQSIHYENTRADDHLAACLAYANDDTTHGAEGAAACHATFERERAESKGVRDRSMHRLLVDVLLAALAALTFGAYFFVVPKRWRGGFRTWIFVLVGGVLLGGAAFLMMLMGISHTD